MATRRAPLKSRQVDVLRWIAAGCPDGVMTGVTHKTTALALQNRKLAVVSRKKGVWAAAVTDAGRHYLEHGGYPAGPADTSPQRPASVERRQPVPPPVSTVAELVAEVVQAGGALAVDRRVDTRAFERLVAAAQGSRHVPANQRLVIDTGDRWDQLTVRLVDLPDWVRPLADHIPVPASLRDPHPVVAALSRSDTLAVTAAVKPQALRLLQALAGEARRRGHDVRPGGFEGGERRTHNSRRSCLEVVVRGHPVSVDVRQQHDRAPHVPTAAELRRAERDTWYRIPAHDTSPSSRLTMDLNPYGVGQTRWNDTATRARWTTCCRR